jgi:hypothetical protein
MSNPFAQPATASGINWSEVHGSLVMIEPLSVELGVKTSLGEKDAIRAKIVVLDGDLQGTEFADALVFPKVLIGQLRSRIGSKVLGRLGQGVAKPGQSPPWRLSEASKEDEALGLAWLNRADFAQPAQLAAAQPQWTQQAPPF